MFNLNYYFDMVNTPIGIGVFAGVVTMLYLILMSINSYLPPVLLLSLTIGYIVYYVQKSCGQCPLPPPFPLQNFPQQIPPTQPLQQMPLTQQSPQMPPAPVPQNGQYSQ